MAPSTLIINLAYVALLSATFTRRILWLRLFLITGAVGFITFGALTQNWSMLGWNIVTGSLHGRQLMRYVMARRAVSLSADDERHRSDLFPELDRFDFSSLWSMGDTVTYDGESITRLAEVHGRIGVVLDGTVSVVRPGSEQVRLGPGALIGEMTFVGGGAATADVRAEGVVTMRQWEHERLATLDQLNPVAGRALHAFLERDLLAKIG